MTSDWLMPDGSPSYNWGAVVGKGTAGTIAHADRTADNKSTTSNFAAFHTPEEGFEFWASRWEKIPKGTGAALKAAADGNARGVAEAMYAACWFTGTSGTDAERIDAYAKVILGAAQHVVPLLDVGADASPELAVQLGQPIGLPLGNCAKPAPSTRVQPTSGLETALLVGVMVGVPLIGWAVMK